MANSRKGLNDPAFAGRARSPVRTPYGYERRYAGAVRPRLVQGVRPAPLVAKVEVAKSQVKKHAVPPSSAKRAVSQRLSRTTRSKVLIRSTVSSPLRRHRPGIRFSSKTAFVSLAVILFLFGIGVGIDGLRANKQVIAQVQSIQEKSAAAETSDVDADAAAVVIPNETNKPDLSTYQVAAGLPRALYIPKIGVKSRVLHMGSTRDGAVASPPNIFDSGWYKASAKPGDPGAVFISGHVHGPTEKGVFVDLKKLRPGDQVKLERGDGQVFSYHVVKVQSYDKDNVDMGQALSSAESGKPGLNLITCDGKYDASGEYDKRLVVFTVQD